MDSLTTKNDSSDNISSLGEVDKISALKETKDTTRGQHLEDQPEQVRYIPSSEGNSSRTCVNDSTAAIAVVNSTTKITKKDENEDVSGDHDDSNMVSDETGNFPNEKQRDLNSSDIRNGEAIDAENFDVDTEEEGNNMNDESVISQSMGAKIIMNRFSTWSKKANDNLGSLKSKAPVLQENAKQASEYAQRVFQNNSFSTISLASRFQKRKSESSSSSNTTKDDTKFHNDQKKEENKTQMSSSKLESDQEYNDVSTSVETNSGAAPTHSLLDNDEDDKEDNDDDVNDNDDDVNIETDVEKDTSVTDPTARMRTVFSKAESVATSFRGRYTLDGSTTAKEAVLLGDNRDEQRRNQSSVENSSQMTLILKSRAGEYMQQILDQLENSEFAMLLGRGMLGVNLKQCYLKNNGVFVDYLVDGGQAQISGLIRPGDLLVRLGEADFRKGTIKDVPLEIARAKRPSVLILATGTKVELERVNYIDIAIAMIHRVRKFKEERGNFSFVTNPKSNDNSNDDKNKTEGETAIIVTQPFEKEIQNGDQISSTFKSLCSVDIDNTDVIEAFMSPLWPTLEVRLEFIEEVSLRCSDNFVISDLSDALALDSNFRAAIRSAFLVCALENRRLPFLARYFSNEEQQLTTEEFGVAAEGVSGNMIPSAQLMLFLELASFLDLYDVTPTTRLRENATRIAYKFFLPTKIGNGIQPPIFDFHHIVPSSSLRHLEFVLNGKSQSIPRDIFLDFQTSVTNLLSGLSFLSFLTSADCSRLRAYLRNTAPYVNVPFKSVIDVITKKEVTKETAAANNYFTCILLYLICRMEKECGGEYDFAIENEMNRRILGATHDICCALFIRRTLLPAISDSNGNKTGESMSETFFQSIVTVVEQFWDLYLADPVELSTKSDKIKDLYYQVRNNLEKVSQDVYKTSISDPSTIVDQILKSTLVKDATLLADELIYDYAANVHSKFRDHKFHEWICNEYCKVLASDPHWYKKQTIPSPPNGCLKRLLRKVNLPNGVSSHKPYKAAPKDETKRTYHNADWAVVFGSSVGTVLSSQMAVPGLNSSDIRRYTCLPVSLDHDIAECNEFRPEEIIPATFESYAFVPPMKRKPFKSLVDSGRMTINGWEVSLVNFTIPNASSNSSGDATESALYGVSLCLQRQSIKDNDLKVEKSIPTVLEVDRKTSEIDESSCNSPVFYEKTKSIDGNEMLVRKVRVSRKLPIFESHLNEQQSWVNRTLREEYRDQSSPVMIGIALVSQRNVIFSMRDSLSRLFFDYSRQPGDSFDSVKVSDCGALVQLLGSCSYQDHEKTVLRTLLEPYLQVASASWVDRPLGAQKNEFEMHSLRQLTDCLPPTSLALLFVTALLEQKIILSSGRRSVLHTACVGLTTLLRPLQWTHLLVPLVPGALANDLIQYPAPFILGVPSEDADSIDLLSNLPRDVTLVDLDVGRVILAPDFGQNNDMCRGTADTLATARALRSQVLYLAQSLGTVFGNSLRPESWICDEPSLSRSTRLQPHKEEYLDRFRLTVKAFVDELLEGSVSCCYWIEESVHNYGCTGESNCDVLFDEDKFFEIKNHRSNQAWKKLFPRQQKSDTGAFALVLDDFDLILESFLRCQSMSIYISSRQKEDMFYYTIL